MPQRTNRRTHLDCLGEAVGTWVTLELAAALARQVNVYDGLKILFEYNTSSNGLPPTAPRSLESVNKRKMASSVRSQDRPSSKRRADGNARPGSLDTILNAASSDGAPPAQLVQGHSPALPSTWHNSPTAHTPVQSRPQHGSCAQAYALPETPGGWPLRDITNMHQAGNIAMHKQRVGDPSASLLTPPSSSSAAVAAGGVAAGKQPYTPLSAASMHHHHYHQPSLLTPPNSRPPVARRLANGAGAQPGQAGLPPPLLLLTDAARGPHDESARAACGSGSDRYSDFTACAMAAIQQAAADVRDEHHTRRTALDSDARYATGLLLDLRAERDTAQAEADRYATVAAECQAAGAREAELQRRVECTVGLQQAARATAGAMSAARTHTPAASDGGYDVSALRAEYRELRWRAAVYEHGSRRLAGEYAQLAATVTPWVRSPAQTLAQLLGAHPDDTMAVLGELLGTARHPRKPMLLQDVADAEAADVRAVGAALAADEERLRKLERVVAAACGDVPLDRVRTAVGPVLSVLNHGSTL
ncbi:hypothetical protein H4R19_003588 [Coemansia spiralis]|nr:hypothetical protein H4R19_003588 [Coemansia spiralis]